MKQDLMRKKNISDLLERKKNTRLPQTLSAFDLIMLGIGAIVGTGIFILPGTVAATHSGPAISISFIIAAFVCCLAGMCYAEFSSKIPVTGSAYIYTYITFGELVAWLVGWALVLEYGLAVASVATGWSAYFNGLLQGFNISIPQALSGPFNPEAGTFINLPAMIIILVLAFFLTRGVRESTNLNKIMVFIKVGIILLFILIGFFYVEPANWRPFMPFGFEGILSGAAIVFFAFLGFDAVSSAAEEVKKPQRNLPIGIIGSLFVCALLYVAVSFVLTGIVPYSDLNVSNPVSYVMAACKSRLDIWHHFYWCDCWYDNRYSCDDLRWNTTIICLKSRRTFTKIINELKCFSNTCEKYMDICDYSCYLCWGNTTFTTSRISEYGDINSLFCCFNWCNCFKTK